MSQKSSVIQYPQSVSQALTGDTPGKIEFGIGQRVKHSADDHA